MDVRIVVWWKVNLVNLLTGGPVSSWTDRRDVWLSG